MGKQSKPVTKPSDPYPGCDELDLALVKEIEATPAITNIVLAEKLGIGREAVAHRRNRREFRDFFAERNLPPREFLKSYRRVAARIMVRFLLERDAKRPDMQMRAAERILGEDLEPDQSAAGVQADTIPLEVAAGLGAYFNALARGDGKGRGTHQRAPGGEGDRGGDASDHGPGTP